MQITLYNFSKKFNSTKIPTGGTQFEGYLRNSDPTNMFNPKIRFAFNSSSAPAYNYMFIPEFGNRYYWISDWVHIEGVWEATCEIDVLATYKTEIGEKDLYVLRSSAEYNPNLIDTLYPAIVSDQETQSLTTSYTLRNLITTKELSGLYNCKTEDGCIVFGIYGSGNNATTQDGITWWLCEPSEFAKLAHDLMTYDLTTAGDDWKFTTDYAETGIAVSKIPKDYAKAIADPIQYFAAIHWYPFSARSLVPSDFNPRSGPSNFGYYRISTDYLAYPYSKLAYNPRITAIYAITKHPQQDRGVWLNSSPYTTYHAYIPPFGEFDVPTEHLLNSTSIIATMYIDLTTANARMQLHSSTGLRYIGTWNGQFGVPITLTQYTYDPRGFMQAATATAETQMTLGNKLINSISRVASKDFTAAIDPMIDAYKGLREMTAHNLDAIEGSQIKVSNVGSIGSPLDFQSNVWPVVTSRFKLITDEYNEEMGRPLNKIRKPKNIPGFILAEHGCVSTKGTAYETNMINQFLEGGFFYE